MMANTSGIASVDAAASLHLAECALDVAMSRDGGEGALRLRGDLVVKILEGDGSVEALVAACKPRFAKLNWFKPKATRSESKEIYLVARGRMS
jgi:23S rRNA U2552 (ribose-2'-O)-methylase RlmE/FtsJ